MQIESLYNTFREQLKGFINSRVKNEQLSEDILHDVFIKVHNNISKLKDDSKLTSWLYTIARNEITDHFLKHRKTDKTTDVEKIIQKTFQNEIEASKKILPAVTNFVNSLPAVYKEALIETEYKGLTQKEYAKKAGISLPAAKSRILRAREKLKQMLLDCCHFEFDRSGEIVDYYNKNCNCCSGSETSKIKCETC